MPSKSRDIVIFCSTLKQIALRNGTRQKLRIAIIIKIKPIIVVVLLFFCPNVLANKIFIDSPNPPPGFESAEINQHLRVSVLFMHQYVGFFYVNIHQGQLKFHAPEHLITKLSGIKKKQTLSLLKQSFPLNIECYANANAASPTSCDLLKTKPIYIIYNPQQETVYLHLAQDLFKKKQTIGAIDFIPDPTSGWSYLNKLGAAGSFSNDNPRLILQKYQSTPNYYNLYSNNILAYGNSSMVGNFSQNNGVDNGQHFQIQNLYAQHIQHDKIYTGGYILNPTSPFFQTQIIAGAGIKTTLETVRNADEMMATPLVIFVPQASQVSIFKNEQLIFSQYLEAGYQRINTNGFPDGGYELIIKVGSSSIINRFFNKGSFLPPAQASQFYVVGGSLTNGMILNSSAYNFLPNVLNIPVLQAGVNTRICDNIALFGDVLLSTRHELFDFGPTVFFGDSYIKTAGLITTKNNYGVYTMLNTQKSRVNVNVIATKIFYDNKRPDYFFLNNLVDNDSASISYRLSKYDLLGIQANYNKSLDQPETYSSGFFYQRNIGQYRGMGFFFNASYNQATHLGNTYALSLSMNFSQGNLAGTESLLWQNQNRDVRSNNQLASPAVAQGSTVYSHQNSQGIGYSFNEIHTISPMVSSLAATYNYTAQQGFAGTYVNYNKINKIEPSIGYGGNLETELAVTQSNVRFNGLNRGDASGIIVQINTTAADNSSKFALIDENNRRIALLSANKKEFISLPGFTDQNYTLINLSKTDYSIKEPTRHVTLYPGNIDYHVWDVEKRIIVLGRLVTKNQHQPLTNVWIHAGENGIFSDDDGNFQLELTQRTSTLIVDDQCQINLPTLNIKRVYLNIGDVQCT